MANKYYNFNGSAAYDLRSSAAQQPRPAVLPEEKPLRQPKKAPKARLSVAPAAIAGLAVVAVLLLMVVYSYVRLYETTGRVGELQAELSAARADTAKLRSTFESRVDLAAIEARAKELGMTMPSTKQTVYLTIAGADHAEVLSVDRRNYVEKTWDAITESFRGMLEYFR